MFSLVEVSNSGQSVGRVVVEHARIVAVERKTDSSVVRVYVDSGESFLTTHEEFEEVIVTEASWGSSSLSLMDPKGRNRGTLRIGSVLTNNPVTTYFKKRTPAGLSRIELLGGHSFMVNSQEWEDILIAAFALNGYTPDP